MHVKLSLTNLALFYFFLFDFLYCFSQRKWQAKQIRNGNIHCGKVKRRKMLEENKELLWKSSRYQQCEYVSICGRICVVLLSVSELMVYRLTDSKKNCSNNA